MLVNSLITVVLIITTVVPSIILALSEAELKSRCSSNPLDWLFLESYSSLSSGLGNPLDRLFLRGILACPYGLENPVAGT